MNKLLVLVEDYPDNNGYVSLMYIHTRNLYYTKKNVDVTVLNFRAKEDYVIDGIKVISLNNYKKQNFLFDILILHAPNLRNHFRFLIRYGNKFKKFIFFFHGHEVLKINSVYSKPYEYVKFNRKKKYIQDIYDLLKLAIWRIYLPIIKEKSYFIFVSKWMQDEFFKWTSIPITTLKNRCFITYNTVGKQFQDSFFDSSLVKKYDFCTIRNNLDGSKYSIDIVNNLAKKTPNKSFLVIGKGKFFEHYNIAPNVTWLDKSLTHFEVINFLQLSKFALMPTRTDAQGLMMCEMAAFGIPVITSDIPVCYEIFEDFQNAYYINNTNIASLEHFTDDMSKCIKHTKFYEEFTVKKEVDLINKVQREVLNVK